MKVRSFAFFLGQAHLQLGCESAATTCDAGRSAPFLDISFSSGNASCVVPSWSAALWRRVRLPETFWTPPSHVEASVFCATKATQGLLDLLPTRNLHISEPNYILSGRRPTRLDESPLSPPRTTDITTGRYVTHPCNPWGFDAIRTPSGLSDQRSSPRSILIVHSVKQRRRALRGPSMSGRDPDGTSEMLITKSFGRATARTGRGDQARCYDWSAISNTPAIVHASMHDLMLVRHRCLFRRQCLPHKSPATDLLIHNRKVIACVRFGLAKRILDPVRIAMDG
jgi:hypothetical protein